MAMEPIVVLVFVVFALVVIRLAHGNQDHTRIYSYLERRGNRVLDVQWKPFGPGWMGSRTDRIYEVRYLDREDNEHTASCRTSGWSGVYWTDDRISRYAREQSAADELASAQEEIRRLRAENDSLRHPNGIQEKPR
jgi:hypothetical protein